MESASEARSRCRRARRAAHPRPRRVRGPLRGASPGQGTFGNTSRQRVRARTRRLLTEPMLASILERVLGFPKDADFPQLGRAASSPTSRRSTSSRTRSCSTRRGPTRTSQPMRRRSAAISTSGRSDYGVLFNLRDSGSIRAARRPRSALSFPLLPLWQWRAGRRSLPDRVDAFARSARRFHRTLWTEEQDRPRPAAAVVGGGWPPARREVDVEFLVERLRALATRSPTTRGAASELDAFLALTRARRRRLLEELRQLAHDIEPGDRPAGLPPALESWRRARVAERVWRQYLLRVAYLALTRILLYRAWEDVGSSTSISTTAASTTPTSAWRERRRRPRWAFIASAPSVPRLSAAKQLRVVPPSRACARRGALPPRRRFRSEARAGRARRPLRLLRRRDRPRSLGQFFTPRTSSASCLTARFHRPERSLPDRGRRAQAAAGPRLRDRLGRIPRGGSPSRDRRRRDRPGRPEGLGRGAGRDLDGLLRR